MRRERDGVVVDQAAYRDAMARLGAAVSVITTDGPAGRSGFTASAVCSITDDPPTLLVCMNRSSSLNEAFKANRVLCVNTLSARQEALSPLFAGQVDASMKERFDVAAWSALATGSPVLANAVVSFDCRITQVTEVGTHSVFFCEVEAIQARAEQEALIYFSRSYHRVVATA